MKIFLENVIRSFGIERCVYALKDYAPKGKHEFVDSPFDADLVVIQVNGRLQHLKKKIALYQKIEKKYVIVQHAVRSTMNPKFEDWADVWAGAELVWTHYDLPIKNVYRTPLGVSESFTYKKMKPKYLVCTSGLSYLTEGARECILAAKGRGRVLHLGPDLGRGFDHVDYVKGVSDEELSLLYNQCQYVSGLRRIEGFELPCAEGLVCGARPIFFEQPWYRDWFKDMSEYVSEAPREVVLDELQKLFSQPYRPVTAKERKAARILFNWDYIIPEFYDALDARTHC